MGGGRGTSRSSSCGDGDGSGDENPDAVTPVARDTLLGTWVVSSSGIRIGPQVPKNNSRLFNGLRDLCPFDDSSEVGLDGEGIIFFHFLMCRDCYFKCDQ